MVLLALVGVILFAIKVPVVSAISEAFRYLNRTCREEWDRAHRNRR